MKSTNLFIHMLRQFFFLSRSTIFFALFRLKCRCLFWVWSVKCEVARYFSLPTWLPNGYSCLFSDFSKERQINTMWTCANEINLCKMGWFFFCCCFSWLIQHIRHIALPLHLFLINNFDSEKYPFSYYLSANETGSELFFCWIVE